MQTAPPQANRLQLLGGLTAAQFLRRYWQKKPLLIRQAIPAFRGVLTRAQLLRLAAHPDCHARLIWRRGRRWQLKHGPLAPADFSARTRAHRDAAAPWTVLVQDIHHVAPRADALLRLFNFLPYARLDDLMASYATNGGGVGAHVDSYDVFLLQGVGERRWQISRQRDLALAPDAPIKLLRDFVPQEEWLLRPGDMLYLPPGVAHCGIAVGECITYSIGFRAPTHAALQQGMLRFLEDRCTDLTLYADPDLRSGGRPAAINRHLLGYCQQILEQVKWSRADMVTFLGQYLSEPKATTFFTPPARLHGRAPFLRAAHAHGVALHAKTRMLYCGVQLFVNGEHYPRAAANALLRRLADERGLSKREVQAGSSATAALLFDWYRAGFLTLCR